MVTVTWSLSRSWFSDEEGCRASSPERVNEWLRYAARRVVKSVKVDLGPLIDGKDHQVAVELPSHGRATSISLDLSGHRLRLPATTARYEALTELQLLFVLFDEEVPLGDFVMSCCPRLGRLDIRSAPGLTQLVLRSQVLMELAISFARDLQMLDTIAPNLRVLKLDPTSQSQRDLHILKVARIVAPRLEEIHGNFPYRPTTGPCTLAPPKCPTPQRAMARHARQVPPRRRRRLLAPRELPCCPTHHRACST